MVSLRCETAKDMIIHGRFNDDTTAWYLDSAQALYIPAADIEAGGWKWIVED